MLMPPEAEPVIADRTVTDAATDAATDTSGLPPPTARMVSLIRSKTGREAMTSPNPTRLAVLKIGRTECCS